MLSNSLKLHHTFVFSCLLIWLSAFSTFKAEGADIESARLWRAPDHTRLVFDISAPVDYKIFALENPDRLVIDIIDGLQRTSFDNLDLSTTPIAKIRSAVRNKDDLRVVLDMTTSVDLKHFALKANAQYSDRLVIDLYDQKRPVSRSVVEVIKPTNRKIIIAVDAVMAGKIRGLWGRKKFWRRM